MGFFSKIKKFFSSDDNQEAQPTQAEPKLTTPEVNKPEETLAVDSTKLAETSSPTADSQDTTAQASDTGQASDKDSSVKSEQVKGDLLSMITAANAAREADSSQEALLETSKDQDPSQPSTLSEESEAKALSLEAEDVGSKDSKAILDNEAPNLPYDLPQGEQDLTKDDEETHDHASLDIEIKDLGESKQIIQEESFEVSSKVSFEEERLSKEEVAQISESKDFEVKEADVLIEPDSTLTSPDSSPEKDLVESEPKTQKGPKDQKESKAPTEPEKAFHVADSSQETLSETSQEAQESVGAEATDFGDNFASIGEIKEQSHLADLAENDRRADFQRGPLFEAEGVGESKKADSAVIEDKAEDFEPKDVSLQEKANLAESKADLSSSQLASRKDLEAQEQLVQDFTETGVAAAVYDTKAASKPSEDLSSEPPSGEISGDKATSLAQDDQVKASNDDIFAKLFGVKPKNEAAKVAVETKPSDIQSTSAQVSLDAEEKIAAKEEILAADQSAARSVERSIDAKDLSEIKEDSLSADTALEAKDLSEIKEETLVDDKSADRSAEKFIDAEDFPKAQEDTLPADKSSDAVVTELKKEAQAVDLPEASETLPPTSTKEDVASGLTSTDALKSDVSLDHAQTFPMEAKLAQADDAKKPSAPIATETLDEDVSPAEKADQPKESPIDVFEKLFGIKSKDSGSKVISEPVADQESLNLDQKEASLEGKKEQASIFEGQAYTEKLAAKADTLAPSASPREAEEIVAFGQDLDLEKSTELLAGLVAPSKVKEVESTLADQDAKPQVEADLAKEAAKEEGRATESQVQDDLSKEVPKEDVKPSESEDKEDLTKEAGKEEVKPSELQVEDDLSKEALKEEAKPSNPQVQEDLSKEKVKPSDATTNDSSLSREERTTSGFLDWIFGGRKKQPKPSEPKTVEQRSEVGEEALAKEPKASDKVEKVDSAAVGQDDAKAAMTLKLRQAPPKLSAWLAIILDGVEEKGDLLYDRLEFLLTSLDAPADEVKVFIDDFKTWLERMDYEYVDEFRSELQYRLAVALEMEDEEDERNRLLLKIQSGLSKTREQLAQKLDGLFTSHGSLDEEFWETLEEIFITADLGYEAAINLVERLRNRVRQTKATKPEELRELLREELTEIFKIEPHITAYNPPEVILMVGVNGVGKTTTIGKLANRERLRGRKVMITAGDTFRAAAIEQLEVWAKRAGALFYSKPQGSDPASVAYEAMDYALKEGVDLLFIDTAGRLQTKTNLMEELKKIRTVTGKKHAGAPHRTILVLDATTGQNALSQVKLFQEACKVDELIVTKLDGTAKGGFAIALALQFNLPITYIGLGEKMEDLRPFNGADFANSLLQDTKVDVA